MTGVRPTECERRIIVASRLASIATGMGIVLHTDSWPNAKALLEEYLSPDLDPRRLMLGHLRCSDPLDQLTALGMRGVTLSFDQVGHPLRDSYQTVARRLADLWEAGVGSRITVSSDVGRRSRLTAQNGSGYIGDILRLSNELRNLGFHPSELGSMFGSAARAFMSVGGSHSRRGTDVMSTL